MIEMWKVRGKTKFLNEPYMSYGEEKTEVLTKKFAIYTIPISSDSYRLYSREWYNPVGILPVYSVDPGEIGL